MKDIVIDAETLEPIDELADRNEKIIEALEPKLQKFLAKKKATENLKKPQKLEYMFTKQLYLALSKFPPQNIDYFSVSYETLNDLWIKFQELTAYYNEYFEIVDNKQLFMAFCNMDSRQYIMLENSDNDKIRSLMDKMHNIFVGLGYAASESGNADPRAVYNRLRASGVAGHSIISAVEEKVIQKADGYTQNEFERMLSEKGIALIER